MEVKGCLVSLAAARPERRVLEEREWTHDQRPVSEVRFRVQGSGSRAQDAGFRVQDSESRAQGSRFRVQDLGVGFDVRARE